MSSFRPSPNLYAIPFAALLLLPAYSAFANLLTGSPVGTYGTFLSREFLWKSLGVILVVLQWMHFSGASFRRPQFANTDATLLGVLLALSLITSSLVAPNSTLAYQQTFVLLLTFLVGYCAYWGFLRLRGAYSNAAYYAAIIGIVLHIPFVFLALYLNWDVSDYPWAIGIPGMRGIRPYNYLLEVGIAVGLGMLVFNTAQKPLMRAFLLLAVTLCFMMLFWSGGRGGLLSIGIALLLVSFMFPHKTKPLLGYALVTALLGLGLSAFIWVPPAEGYGVMQMFLRSLQLDVNALATGRLVIWEYAIGYIQQRPFFGHGVNQFSILFSTNPPFSPTPPPHLHNSVLEVVLSWGLIGTALVAALAFRMWKKMFSRVRHAVDGTQVPALLALIALAAHSLISGTYYHVPSLFYIGLFAGICLAPNPAQNKNTSR